MRSIIKPLLNIPAGLLRKFGGHTPEQDLTLSKSLNSISLSDYFIKTKLNNQSLLSKLKVSLHLDPKMAGGFCKALNPTLGVKSIQAHLETCIWDPEFSSDHQNKSLMAWKDSETKVQWHERISTEVGCSKS